MKAILMSIKPQWVAKILNKEKTIEVRKRFPSDYVGWVYIYNTKDTKYGYLTTAYVGNKLQFITPLNKHEKYRGKVVARFWCDKVEKVHCNSYGLEISEHWYRTTNKNEKELLNKCALTFDELDDYLYFGNGYAIHITKLEIFDKPKEISEFYKVGYEEEYDLASLSWDSEEGDYHSSMKYLNEKYQLTRAPQSWCYIEV